MPDTIRNHMTPMPIALSPEQSIIDAAAAMRDEGIGDVLVVDGERLVGLVTDRDIVIRLLADGLDMETATVGDACTDDVVAIGPDASIADAVRTMQDNAVRRLPVVEDGRPIGIVSIGDLAIDVEPDSALGRISSAPENR